MRPGGVDQSRHQGSPGDSRTRDHEQRAFISNTQWLQHVDVEYSWGTPRRSRHLHVSSQHGSYEESGTNKLSSEITSRAIRRKKKGNERKIKKERKKEGRRKSGKGKENGRRSRESFYRRSGSDFYCTQCFGMEGIHFKVKSVLCLVKVVFSDGLHPHRRRWLNSNELCSKIFGIYMAEIRPFPVPA